jgi:hypothetical protein
MKQIHINRKFVFVNSNAHITLVNTFYSQGECNSRKNKQNTAGWGT